MSNLNIDMMTGEDIIEVPKKKTTKKTIKEPTKKQIKKESNNQIENWKPDYKEYEINEIVNNMLHNVTVFNLDDLKKELNINGFQLPLMVCGTSKKSPITKWEHIKTVKECNDQYEKSISKLYGRIITIKTDNETKEFNTIPQQNATKEEKNEIYEYCKDFEHSFANARKNNRDNNLKEGDEGYNEYFNKHKQETHTYSDLNICIKTGFFDDMYDGKTGIFGLDIDNNDELKEFLKDNGKTFDDLNAYNTLSEITGSGSIHIYYLVPERFKTLKTTTTSKIKPGIDTRCQQGVMMSFGSTYNKYWCTKEYRAPHKCGGDDNNCKYDGIKTRLLSHKPITIMPEWLQDAIYSALFSKNEEGTNKQSKPKKQKEPKEPKEQEGKIKKNVESHENISRYSKFDAEKELTIENITDTENSIVDNDNLRDLLGENQLAYIIECLTKCFANGISRDDWLQFCVLIRNIYIFKETKKNKPKNTTPEDHTILCMFSKNIPNHEPCTCKTVWDSIKYVPYKNSLFALIKIAEMAYNINKDIFYKVNPFKIKYLEIIFNKENLEFYKNDTLMYFVHILFYGIVFIVKDATEIYYVKESVNGQKYKFGEDVEPYKIIKIDPGKGKKYLDFNFEFVLINEVLERKIYNADENVKILAMECAGSDEETGEEKKARKEYEEAEKKLNALLKEKERYDKNPKKISVIEILKKLEWQKDFIFSKTMSQPHYVFKIPKEIRKKFDEHEKILEKHRNDVLNEHGEEIGIKPKEENEENDDEEEYENEEDAVNISPSFPITHLIPYDKINMEGMRPILDHIKNIWCDGDDYLYRYTISYLHHVFNFSEKRKRSDKALILLGEEGTGKTLLLEAFIEHFLGFNMASKVAITDFKEKFNSQFRDKVVILCEEFEAAGSKQDKKLMGSLKNFITANIIDIEAKHENKASYVRNYCNLLFSTNTIDPLIFSEKDRRFFILQVSSSKIGDASYFGKLNSALQNKTVMKHLFSYLFHYVLSKDYINIYKVGAPRTQPLLNKIEECKDIIEKFILSDTTPEKLESPYIQTIYDEDTSTYKTYTDQIVNLDNLYTQFQSWALDRVKEDINMSAEYTKITKIKFSARMTDKQNGFGVNTTASHYNKYVSFYENGKKKIKSSKTRGFVFNNTVSTLRKKILEEREIMEKENHFDQVINTLDKKDDIDNIDNLNI